MSTNISYFIIYQSVKLTKLKNKNLKYPLKFKMGLLCLWFYAFYEKLFWIENKRCCPLYIVPIVDFY